VSHFLEHMMFKGTARRTAMDVNLDFDRIGADYNAFTSEENTVYHACFLPEYLDKAVDVLTDIMRPSLREEDFDVEKKVIIEEIGRYDDQPGHCAYERAKQVHFGKHHLANSVLGTKESVGALTPEQMRAYFGRRYVAPNILVSVAGNVEWPRFIELIEKQCGGWPAEAAGREGLQEARSSGQHEVMTKDKVVQEYVFLVAGGPPAASKLRYAADLLAVILGDDSGSRLYWELVDPGLADSADTSYHDYDGAGAFWTSLTCEPDQTDANLALTLKVFQAVQRQGVTAEEFQQARNKVLSRIVRGNERPKGRMMAVGMNWMYQGEYRTVDDELRAFEALTPATIREVLERYPLDRTSLLALGPLSKVRVPWGA
jgi:predicted Zn-dependent peptidase